METPTDSNILVAVITAAVSITIATITFSTKLVLDYFDRTRISRSQLMNIRNEIVINKRLAEIVGKSARTFGIRFKDLVWSGNNTSVIYKRNVPSELILNLYANVQSFNTLNDRYEKIMKDDNYRNKDNRLPIEHAEMIQIAEEIESQAKIILDEIKI